MDGERRFDPRFAILDQFVGHSPTYETLVDPIPARTRLMLRIENAWRSAFCDGVSRRTMLHVGALGTLGLGLPELAAAAGTAKKRTTSAGASFGRTKRVILLFLWGGPAHQDTWDLKPEGPVGTRGEFRPIATNVPGIEISEHFPHLAGQADKYAILRSVGQEDNNHSTGAHAGLTGRRHDSKAENFGARPTDFPHYGSVLSALRPNRGGMPTCVSLPEIIATTAGAITPGQFGGLLGRQYDPFQITEHPDRRDFAIPVLRMPAGVSGARMASRASLLEQVEQAARVAERSVESRAMGDFYRQALDMVLSPAARQAFDLSGTTVSERFRYGWHPFGQSVLLARRLVEAGVQLVTVYWHRDKSAGPDPTWDTHSNNFTQLKHRLMPSVDRTFAVLLQDLADRGMLEDTLVVWNSEFGRTPRINGSGAGRDHWGPCNSVVMAGGGVPGGQVFGASDENAAYPVRDKVTQDDIAATIYHLLGYEPETLVHDRTGRPWPVALGHPIGKLLGSEAIPEDHTPLERLAVRTVGSSFAQSLESRGIPAVVCEVRSPRVDLEWQAAGWLSGPGATRGPLGAKPVDLKYTGVATYAFDGPVLLVRTATPVPLAGLQVAVDGRTVPLPTVAATERRTLWQIPLGGAGPLDVRKAVLRLTAPDWPATELALVEGVVSDEVLAEVGRA